MNQIFYRDQLKGGCVTSLLLFAPSLPIWGLFSIDPESNILGMRQVPLERDINVAVNECSGFATSIEKRSFMAMLISRSRGTYPFA